MTRLTTGTNQIVVETGEARATCQISRASGGGITSKTAARGRAGKTEVEAGQTELIASIVVVLGSTDTSGSGDDSMLSGITGEAAGVSGSRTRLAGVVTCKTDDVSCRVVSYFAEAGIVAGEFTLGSRTAGGAGIAGGSCASEACGVALVTNRTANIEISAHAYATSTTHSSEVARAAGCACASVAAGQA